ncbi:nuclear SAM-dependent mono-and asymmetric arginine dimethylating methyltransferase [Syncephalis fuscata]|nr:nuclear SAM-dependent mono-and asymmetric arginine dimethylating methyltransferase [Syncephalis fuscata]
MMHWMIDPQRNNETDEVVPAIPEHTTDGYFTSYAHIDIHDQMLKDRVRTEAYRDFIYENKPIFKDKIVLDVGCGTGILSMFAARAGAAQVYAVDNSDIIEQARLIAAENQLDTKIKFIRGKIEEIELPVPVVDIIISEWMGYFLLFEAMLDSVLVARDKYLAPDGFLAPSGSSIHLMGIEDDYMMNDKVDFWKDVYGFSMNTIGKSIYNEAIVNTVPENTRITDTACLQTFDHNVVNSAGLDFKTSFELQADRDAVLHAFLGYFDIDFSTPEDMPGNQIVFTTGPHGVETHWKQTTFILTTPILLKKGDRITGEFICRKSEHNPRELEIVISYEKKAIAEEESLPQRTQTFQLQ